MIKALAVFCGSKSGNNKLFVEEATQLGYLMAEKNITLIYGGGGKGIMGAVANAVLEKNGNVIGIIPQRLTEWEAHHTGITDLLIVEDMHIRKKMLYDKADAAIILPGGFGTLDEMFEILTWNQLSIHDKKIFILNTAGFYDALIQHIKMMEQEGFLYSTASSKISILNNANEMAEYFS